MRVARTLAGACLAVLFVSPPAQAAAPASCGLAKPDRVVTGEFPASLQGSYVLLPFTVPAGQTAVRIRYCYDQPETPLSAQFKHTLDLDVYGPRRPGALWGEREFRGSSGSAKREGESGRPQVTLAEDGFGVPGGTTRSMKPGPIVPGEWAVQLPVAAVVDQSQGDLDGKVAFRVEIDLLDDPAFADQPYRPAPYRTAPARRGRGWYVGDLHTHANHSEGGATMKDAFDFAFGSRAAGGAGLDFVSLSDHNTDSAWGEIGSFQAAYPGKLIIRGAEVTTFRGHMMNHGSGRYADHRTGAVYVGAVGADGRLGALTLRRGPRGASDILREVKAAGGFTQMNHPTIFPSEVPAFANLCRGCSWSYPDSQTGYPVLDGIEVATGPAELNGQGPNPFTVTAIDFFDQRLARGFKVAALGVSDSHDAGRTTGPTSSPIGTGSTAVLAEELSEPGIECGIEAGRTYAKVTGPGGPDVRMEARPPGYRGSPATFGDTVLAGAAEFAVKVTGGSGRTLQVVKDGRTFRTVPVPGDDFTFSFIATDPGRYRLQVQRGQTIETVSSPVHLEPGRGTVSARDCTPLSVRGTARRRLRPRRQRYATRCTASGAGLRACAVSATIRTGRRGRRRTRTVATGRVAMTGGSRSRRVRLRLNRYGRRVMRRHARTGRRVRLTFTVNDGDGATASARRTVRLLRARKRKR